MSDWIYATVTLAATSFVTATFLGNWREYNIATKDGDRLNQARQIPASVLIPARNEAAGIAVTLNAILKSTHSIFEVLVLDDHSDDDTASIVKQISQIDPRVQYHAAPDLPPGWNGKQHACYHLSRLAQYDRFLFLDADVHLSPDAITRCVAQQEIASAPLISGFPRQRTGTWSEKLLIPLMHYVLLGFLPIHRMRQSTSPAYSAGCGQLFLAERNAYEKAKGHAAIQASRHDGIQLPKAFRRSGLRTDLFDATDIADCRMYHGLNQTVRGLLKNASEGIANPVLILPFTVMLVAAAIAPWGMLAYAIFAHWSMASLAILGLASIVSLVPRYLAMNSFRQPPLGVCLHPMSVIFFLAIQWWAFVSGMLGFRVQWRGRT